MPKTLEQCKDLIAQLDAELEALSALYRQAEKDGDRCMINRYQNDITRVVLKMSQIKSEPSRG